MFITSETGQCRSHSVLLYPHLLGLRAKIILSLHSSSLLSETEVFSLVLYVVFASKVQCLSVIENIVVTLLLSNFHFPRSSKDCRWVCAVFELPVWYFFTQFMQMPYKRKLTLLCLTQLFVMGYVTFFKFNGWV